MVRIFGASPNLEPQLAESPALEKAVDLVLRADRERGRAGFNLAKTQIVRLPAPRGEGPAFCCCFPPNREDRPVNSGPDGGSDDPLSIGSVRQSGQSYFIVDCNGLQLLLLANPYGYAERCATWPAVNDIEQADAGSGAAPWGQLIEAMLTLSIALRGDIVAFNALAGNSMKRLHFVSHRPLEGIGPYALQKSADAMMPRGGLVHIGRGGEYPLDAWRFGFAQYRDSVAAAAGLIERWHFAGGAFATVSVAAVLEEGAPVVYVIPRHRLLSPFGWPGMPAVMEVMGVGVTSRVEFVNRVRNGDWGHENYRRFLESLRPHGVERLY